MGTEPVVIRNGRCTSQISIYDYPEHLNPFYEDENHKRLRFWKLGKRNGESRRGSFSLNLKEMWAFKSFRLKKKSSSLGINKTSESPPSLRRELNPSEIHFGTYDSRIRHTTGATLNGHFQRNAPYRTSLHDMRQDVNINDPGFIRNDRYRSTIQTAGMRSGSTKLSPRVPERRYVYGGSVTPQPIRSSGYSENYKDLSRGSSQISVASTNPFDEDEDDMIIGKTKAGNSSEEYSPTKRPARKKRRAPPPPIPVPKVIVEESSNVPATPSTSHNNQNKNEDKIDITNLTAEIESFVKTKTNSSENIGTLDNKVVDIENKVITTPTTNDCLVADSDKPVQHANTTELAEHSPEFLVNIKVDENKNEFVETTTTKDSNVTFEATENIACGSNEDKYNELDQYPLVIREDDARESQNKETEQGKHAEEPNVNLIEEPNLSIIELKITESKENLSEISNEATTNKYHLRYIPLKQCSLESENEIQSTRNICTKKEELKISEVTGHEKRRSVKEIIASINHSQSLLKVNQDQVRAGVNNLDQPIKAPPRRKNEAKENLIRNFTEVSENDQEIKKILREMKDTKNVHCENKIQTDNEVNEMIEKLVDNLNNNEDNQEIFKKCSPKKEINRESSPTSLNLDWNPVPKPKRTKNLSPELVRSKN